MIPTNLTKGGFLVLGFAIMALASTWLTFKQARVVDAFGDVASVKAEISELRQEAREDDDEDKNKEEIKELLEEDVPAQMQDAQDAMAALPNGAVIWTLISQIGAAIFGLGVISIFLKEEENNVVRSTALLLVGGMIISFIVARFIYLMIAGGTGMGGSL